MRSEVWREPHFPWNDPGEVVVWGIGAVIGAFIANSLMVAYHRKGR